MSTATDTGTGLDWVVFEEHDHTESCDFRTDPCSRQATHAGIFRVISGGCDHFRIRVLYCIPHRDLILRRAELGRFYCHTCGHRTLGELVRMVSL